MSDEPHRQKKKKKNQTTLTPKEANTPCSPRRPPPTKNNTHATQVPGVHVGHISEPAGDCHPAPAPRRDPPVEPTTAAHHQDSTGKRVVYCHQHHIPQPHFRSALVHVWSEILRQSVVNTVFITPFAPPRFTTSTRLVVYELLCFTSPRHRHQCLHGKFKNTCARAYAQTKKAAASSGTKRIRE
jgi:hypothetical protein